MDNTRSAHRGEEIVGKFLSVGILPLLLVLAILYFSLMSDRFLTGGNILNISRQSIYLLIIALGQMVVLLTAGFDLAVGAVVAISSIATAKTMVALGADSPTITICVGIVAGIVAGAAVGVVNGLGVAYFHVSPFIMTLGTASMGAGIALMLTAGVPVTGMPREFGEIFGYGRIFGFPVPVVTGMVLIILMLCFVEFTRIGKYLYAVGGNIKAARLSGINERKILFLAYLLSSILASLAGILLTARLGSGEPNIGTSYPMESIAACVIAGVSLLGGQGRVFNVIFGVLFIGVIQNGMSLARVDSYLQMVIIGAILIFAVIIDRVRSRYLGLDVV